MTIRGKIINHHVAGGTGESHPHVQDLQSCIRLEILDARMGFSRPSLDVVTDYVNLSRLSCLELWQHIVHLYSYIVNSRFKLSSMKMTKLNRNADKKFADLLTLLEDRYYSEAKTENQKKTTCKQIKHKRTQLKSTIQNSRNVLHTKTPHTLYKETFIRPLYSSRL